MKKQVCKYFQLGFCQYGERCKFLHPVTQQPKPNPFGFGTQSSSHQQQKPNSFGFGVPSSSQAKGSADFGSKQNQFKHFENKWVRPSSMPAGSGPSPKQPDTRPQAPDHQCSDPEACKRIMAADFQEERPVWKLSCYGHFKYLPCDITGDISYEELRAAAYEDAKHGLSLQSIVERERNLLNSKLIEYENLSNNPHSTQSNSALASKNPSTGISLDVFSNAAQIGAPPTVTSFSQLGRMASTGTATRHSFSSNKVFGQSHHLPSSGQTSSALQKINEPFGTAGLKISGGTDTIQSAFTSSGWGFGDGHGINAESSMLSTLPALTQNQGSANNLAVSFNGPYGAFSNVGQATTESQLMQSNEKEKNVCGDMNIWLKAAWNPGEIPEEAPPDELCLR